MIPQNFYILLSVITCLKASSWDDLTANIGVVEYQSINNPILSPDERIIQNTLRYIEILKTNNASNLDLVIFPEATLRNDPETAVEIQMDNPCISKTYPQFMIDLSCAANQFQTYLIINLVEKVKCNNNNQSPNCEDFGFSFYNTDVVFNRKGSIIQRYRKFNLFGERDLDRPTVPERVIFETDFGIKFGIFTCFDILFKRPAQDLLEERPDGIIFPSMWFSELPFLTALQTQQMWAYSHNIPLFGAGANEHQVGSGGSGIYRGSKTTAVEGFVASGGSKMFVYKSMNGEVLPSPHEDIDALGRQMDGFKLFTDKSVLEFNFTLVDPSVEKLKQEICHGGLCCNFDLRMSTKPVHSKNAYTYVLVAFSGVRSYRGNYNGGTELCAVIACLDSTLSSCGQRFPKYEDIGWPIIFENITIEATFENTENKTQFPNSLLSSVRPIDASETFWFGKVVEKNGKQFVERSFSLRKSQERLLTFAIYGRDFERDSPQSVASTNSKVITWFLIGCTLILSYYTRPTR